MDKFLDRYQVPKSNQYLFNDLNNPISPKEIEAVINSLKKKKNPGLSETLLWEREPFTISMTGQMVPHARCWLSLPPPYSLPATWGCKIWIIVPSSLSLPELPCHPTMWVMPEPGLKPKAVKEYLCSGDKMHSARHLDPDFGPHVTRCPLLCSL